MTPLVTLVIPVPFNRLVLVPNPSDLVRKVSVPNVSNDSERVNALRVLVVTVLVSRRPLSAACNSSIRLPVDRVPVLVMCVRVCE